MGMWWSFVIGVCLFLKMCLILLLMVCLIIWMLWIRCFSLVGLSEVVWLEFYIVWFSVMWCLIVIVFIVMVVSEICSLCLWLEYLIGILGYWLCRVVIMCRFVFFGLSGYVEVVCISMI